MALKGLHGLLGDCRGPTLLRSTAVLPGASIVPCGLPSMLLPANGTLQGAGMSVEATAVMSQSS